MLDSISSTALCGLVQEWRPCKKQAGELLRNALEQLLTGCAFVDESVRHLQLLRKDVADSSLDVVGVLLLEVATVLDLHVQH